jgi:hypothetical protein
MTLWTNQVHSFYSFTKVQSYYWPDTSACIIVVLLCLWMYLQHLVSQLIFIFQQLSGKCVNVLNNPIQTKETTYNNVGYSGPKS